MCVLQHSKDRETAQMPVNAERTYGKSTLEYYTAIKTNMSTFCSGIRQLQSNTKQKDIKITKYTFISQIKDVMETRVPVIK